jgi:UDPglucose 6-dehydrogenase
MPLFNPSIFEAINETEIIFIAVGTPQNEDGSADLTHVLKVAKEIGKKMNHPLIVVDKSTVPLLVHG